MALIARWAQETPDKVACHFVESGTSLTFRQLDARANRIAQWLIGLGLQPQDGIALLFDNGPHCLEFGFACRRAGLYYTPLSIHLRPREVAHVLRDSGAKLLVVSPALADLAAEILREGAAGGLLLYAIDAGLPGYQSVEQGLAAYPAPAPLPQRPVGREFLYSSGTTGLPKGIRRPLLPASEHGAPDLQVPFVTLYGFHQDMVYLSPAPLYHAAPHRFVQRTLHEGGTVVILKKFDPALALHCIERFRVTHSQWVPTMFVRLLSLPEAERRRHDLSTHRYAIHAAAPCPVRVKREMIDWWGPIIWEYYAGSESVGTTVIDSETWLEHPGSVGRIVNNGIIHILDEAGNELPPGAVGQVWFEGGTRFQYHNDPAKTAAAWNDRGYATLGDLGSVTEDGFLYLSDRRADLILSGGVNIYPQEIEDVLARHPLVQEVAVIGIPHEEFGESVKAVVQLRDPSLAEPQAVAALTAWCKQELAGPKQPRSYDFVEHLPRSETGKLLRRILKERYRPPG